MEKHFSFYYGIRGLDLVVLVIIVFLCPGSIKASAKSEAGLCYQTNLDFASSNNLSNFFSKLESLEKGENRTIRILQLGDSHTASDQMSGRLRDLFQTQFGNAGRGMLPPGKPFPYYSTSRMKVGQTNSVKIIKSHLSAQNYYFGISGFRASINSPEDMIWMEAERSNSFSKVYIETITGPDSGTFGVRIDGKTLTNLSARRNVQDITTFQLDLTDKAHRFEVSALGDGKVDILSLTFEKESPGIIYDSHGVIGATVKIISQWDSKVITKELMDRAPDLIVLQYGTNEGYDDNLNPAEYEKCFRDTIRFLANLLPESGILVISPPDAARLNKRVVNARESWTTPPKLEVVRQIQRRVAREEKCTYWNWAGIMGGTRGINKWVLSQEPLARKDHVHFSAAGYRVSADSLYAAIMKEYNEYKDNKYSSSWRFNNSGILYALQY